RASLLSVAESLVADVGVGTGVTRAGEAVQLIKLLVLVPPMATVVIPPIERVISGGKVEDKAGQKEIPYVS
ncbi:MAG: hypothetical protein M3Y28_06885, partial [Armatimonadota bacterium]|nr:hypothetical protein [Armatimonadota bacterium]